MKHETGSFLVSATAVSLRDGGNVDIALIRSSQRVNDLSVFSLEPQRREWFALRHLVADVGYEHRSVRAGHVETVDTNAPMLAAGCFLDHLVLKPKHSRAIPNGVGVEQR